MISQYIGIIRITIEHWLKLSERTYKRQHVMHTSIYFINSDLKLICSLRIPSVESHSHSSINGVDVCLRVCQADGLPMNAACTCVRYYILPIST